MLAQAADRKSSWKAGVTSRWTGFRRIAQQRRRPIDALNTLWFGDRLRYLERLSIASALANGHAVRVYSYAPDRLQGVPDGVELRDAREVMSDPRRTRLLEGKYRALGSDFFRYEIFAQELGYWMDLDVILLKPLDFRNKHVFGWENDGISVNGAVLRIPRTSPMLEELRNIPEANWCPPFFGPRRRAVYYWQRITKGTVHLEDLPWGVAGPAMITYLARKHGLMDQVQPRTVFYPVPYDRAEALFDDASVVEGMLAQDTVAVHMWNSRLRDLVDRPPPAGSYVGRLCQEHGVRYD